MASAVKGVRILGQDGYLRGASGKTQCMKGVGTEQVGQKCLDGHNQDGYLRGASGKTQCMKGVGTEQVGQKWNGYLTATSMNHRKHQTFDHVLITGSTSDYLRLTCRRMRMSVTNLQSVHWLSNFPLMITGS